MVDQSTAAQELQEAFSSITDEVTQRFASRNPEIRSTQDYYSDAETSTHSLTNVVQYSVTGWRVEAKNEVRHTDYYASGYHITDVASHWTIKAVSPDGLSGYTFEMEKNAWFNRLFLHRHSARIRSENSEFKRQIRGDDALQRRFRNNFLTFQITSRSYANRTTLEATFTVDEFSEVKVMLAIESIELILKNINRIERIS